MIRNAGADAPALVLFQQFRHAFLDHILKSLDPPGWEVGIVVLLKPEADKASQLFSLNRTHHPTGEGNELMIKTIGVGSFTDIIL